MSAEFLKACSVNDLEDNKGYLFVVDDINEVAIFRVNGIIYAVDNVCPHNHTPKIHLGYIEEEHVLCPVHFFKFSLKDGKQKDGTGCTLKTYRVKIENDEVFVEKPGGKNFDFDFT
ncbi:MAG: Rieske (2Fe-2S) protein [Candidatus Kapaibacterium sp.]